MRTLCMLILLFSAAALAQAAQPYVPPQLEPWKQWVLEGHAEVACPVQQGKHQRQRLCQWPGTLHLELDDHGGRFNLQWWSASPG